jgi:hypothetical protein
MVDAVLVPAIKGGINANEICNGSPYVPSYARLAPAVHRSVIARVTPTATPPHAPHC